ncbi:substrate-binding domain-containing protein [Sporosarcina sp. ZBG7A]|uniref:substrate-binding domain-containing protein n=1 Tax=Sporosarcina sp. ZBG7A TaxID=1582223 RepID=UPI0006922FEF|nr:substrate-binding domain-containing protein [Sporosarcina sp. ZBG7A]
MAALLSAMLLVVLLVLTFIAFIIAMMNGTAYHIPFIIVFPTVLYLAFSLSLYRFFNTRKRILTFIGIASIALAITGYVPLREAYTESIPTVNEEVNPTFYQPFREDSKLAQLGTPASLKLQESLPKLDGETWLYPMYAAFVEAVYPEGDYPSYMKDGLVMGDGGGYSFTHLIEGKADMIFTTAPMKWHYNKAKKAGLELTVTPIGKEAFVFFVNEKNPVQNMTTQQIREIYAGTTENWDEVGGKDMPIIAYQRKESSRGQKALEQFMEDTPLTKPATEAEFREGYGNVKQRAEYRNYKNAIGFSHRFTTLELMEKHKIKLLNIDGVAPTNDSIRSGEYPLVREFYIVTAGTDNPKVQQFIDWIVSEEGQQLMEKSGYVSLQKGN